MGAFAGRTVQVVQVPPRPRPSRRSPVSDVHFPKLPLGDVVICTRVSGSVLTPVLLAVRPVLFSRKVAREAVNVPWQTQVLRLTLFVRAPATDIATLWRDIVGADPVVDEHRVREGVRRQAGPHGNGQLEVVAAAGRIDVSMTPPTDAVLPVATFGAADVEVPSFVALLEPWLGRGGAALDPVRIAVGSVLLLPANDRVESYRNIGQFVPSVTVDPEHSKELFYRINRPMVWNGIELNRITAWASLVARTTMLGPAGGVSMSEQQFTRLEIDHSTPVDRVDALDRNQLIPIFRQLVAMALENAERGEIP